MFGMRHFEHHCAGKWGGGRAMARPARLRRPPRHGRRRHDARRPHAGAGRPAADRARADRRAAAPRLRDHEGAGGQDRGLVRAEPGHRLSDADLSRGDRLRHRAGRGRQEALHHHRRKAARISTRTATSSMRCSSASPPSARRSRAGAAAATTTTSGAPTCRRWCAPRSTICARPQPSGSPTTPRPRRKSSRCSRAPPAN